MSVLSNITSHRYQHLDGWRGLSIIAVLIGHFMPLPGINAGRLGVEMFFVLSGVLMAEILFVKRTKLPIFFVRRISRVWPALFIFIIVAWTVSKFITHGSAITNLQAVSALTFTYNYYSVIGTRSHYLDHIWSLCVEEHIYILLAIIAASSRTFNYDAIKVLLIIWVLMICNGTLQTWIYHYDYYTVYWRTDVRGSSIIVAVITYLYFQNNEKRVSSWLPIASCLLAIVLNTYSIPDPLKYSLGTMIMAIGVCTIKHLPAMLLSVLKSKVLNLVGLISFSVYLWQQPMYQFIGKYPKAFLLIFVLMIATLSYKWIEQPCRSYLNRKFDSLFRISH